MRFGNPEAFWYLLLIPLFVLLYAWSFNQPPATGGEGHIDAGILLFPMSLSG